MGQHQSKDKLLYQQVSYGNVDDIKALHNQGARLEYVDREGKTPLIVACLNPALHNVVKTLVELGANVNAYRSGRNGGTPLHHAAKRGLEKNVHLLLSHGANALLLNDDCQTALDIARAKGFTNIVRAIESHICLFSGWLREPLGTGFLEVLAPQISGFLDLLAPNLLSKKVWAVVLPCGSRNLQKPFRLELAIYASVQEAQPRLKIDLWKATMEEPTFNQPDPAVVITETSTTSRHRRQRGCKPRRGCHTQTRIKLAPVNENDKQQLQQFCNACKGIPQVFHSNFPFNNANPSTPATTLPTDTPTDKEDLELAMAINASIQSAIQEGLPVDHTQMPSNGASSSVTVFPSTSPTHESGLFSPEGKRSVIPPDDVPSPSAPTVTAEDQVVLPDGRVHYPTIDSAVLLESILKVSASNSNEDGSKEGKSSSCAICFDAPVEGACVPCGHMSGCMSCLNEIKAKKFGCPVCRAKIVQVIKVYAV